MSEGTQDGRLQSGHDPVHLVLLVHGINTRAQWINAIKPTLEAAGLSVAPAGYGMYGLLRFLFPWDRLRLKAIERVRIRVLTAIKLHKPDYLSVIAHSFGSYIVARLIAKEFSISWHRIIFCGSVNAQDFPFEQYLERFKSPIINEIGTRDFLPALAESVTWGYGSVGSYGFLSPAIEERWHKGLGHSDFLNSAFCQKFWVPFLHNGLIVPGDSPETLPLLTRVLVRLPLRWIIVAAIVALVFAAGLQIAPYAETGYLRVLNYLTAAPFTHPPTIADYKKATSDQKDQMIEAASTDLENEFNKVTRGQEKPLYEKNFDIVSEFIDFLLAADPHNGKAYYYAGEIKRWLNKDDRTGIGYERSHEDFYKYLDTEARLYPNWPNGRPREGCATKPGGYCPERTAYILFLLSLDFERRGDVAHALNYLCMSLVIRPKGFVQSGGTSKLLERLGSHIMGDPCKKD